MPSWLQHTLVLTLVGACLAYTIWQGARSLFGKRGRLGNCCAKGCSATPRAQKPATDRFVFLPSEMLRKRRKSRNSSAARFEGASPLPTIAQVPQHAAIFDARLDFDPSADLDAF